MHSGRRERGGGGADTRTHGRSRMPSLVSVVGVRFPCEGRKGAWERWLLGHSCYSVMPLCPCVSSSLQLDDRSHTSFSCSFLLAPELVLVPRVGSLMKTEATLDVLSSLSSFVLCCLVAIYCFVLHCDVSVATHDLTFSCGIFKMGEKGNIGESFKIPCTMTLDSQSPYTFSSSAAQWEEVTISSGCYRFRGHMWRAWPWGCYREDII